MKMSIRSSVAISLLLVLFLPLCHAAASAVAAAPIQQSAAARENSAHIGHSDHAGHGPMANGESMAGVGAGKPASWTVFPILKAKRGGEGRDRRMVSIVPENIVANSIEAYSNNLKDDKGHRQLPLEMAGVKLDKPESGGFHWLFAREEQEGQVRVASTVHFFSERGAKNPTAMFMQQKHELEIIPQPYPREHSRYRANEDWEFLVRFNGKPLANQKVFLETANGSKVEVASDAQGVLKVHIPDDFRTEARQKAGGSHDHGRRSSDLVLATEHVDGGKTYLTAFNVSYGPDAFDQRSLAMGLGFTLLGMIGAAPLLRQRKNAKQAADDEPAATGADHDKEA